MGFADEVKTDQAAPATDVAAEQTAEQFFGSVPGTEVSAEGTQENKETQAPPAKIRIGSREFNSQEEALIYAQELEASKIAEDSYREGFTAAQPKVVSTEVDPAEVFLAKIGDKLFEDPAKALRDFAGFVTESTQKQINEKTQREQGEQKMWGDFFSANQDLAEMPEFVKKYTLTRTDVYGNLPADKALQKIGAEIREMMKKQKSSVSTLAGSGSVTVPVGAAPTRTSVAEKENDIDFSTAVRKHGKRELKVRAK